MNFVLVQITNTQHQKLLQNKNKGIIDFCGSKMKLLINFVLEKNKNTQQKNITKQKSCKN